MNYASKPTNYDDVDIKKIMSLDTPTLVLRVSRFRKLYMRFSRFGSVYYPLKANDHPGIIKEVTNLGGCFEVDGYLHIEKLINMGVAPNRIQYSIPIRKPHDVVKSVELGVRRFVVDSTSEYQKIRSVTENGSYIIRLSILPTLNLHQRAYHKWGMAPDEALDLSKSMGSSFLGLSFYLPKSIYSTENFHRLLEQIAHTFRGQRVRVLDIGGGLDDSFSGGLERNLRYAKAIINHEQIIVEPGRNLLDPCIDLIVSVIGVCERGGHTWVYMDAGVYSGLLDAIIIQREYQIQKFPDESSGGRNEHAYILAGPTSDTLDYFGEYTFSSPLKVGDRLLFRNVGAYSFVFQTGFGGIEPLTLEILK